MFYAKMCLLMLNASVVLNTAEAVKNKQALRVIVSNLQGVSCLEK